MKTREIMRDPERTTYILFLINKNNPVRICGPVFEEEIVSLRQRLFSLEEIMSVQVLPEMLFAQKYPKKYQKHIRNCWMDKLWCYFQINKRWIGEVHMFESEHAFAGRWFHIYDGFNEKNKRKELALSTNITADPFLIARLTLDLKDLNLFPLKRTREYFSRRTDSVYVDDEAVRVFLAENCLKSLSMNDSVACN